jgi:hypothetical protein
MLNFNLREDYEMKKIILGFIIFVTGLSVFAAGTKSPKKFSRPYGMAGCGLGSIVMGKQGSQIFAVTTNGTGSNQYFGLTSGTSNCVDGAEQQVAGQSDLFIRANRLTVQMDIARGSGESLAGLSQILGCNDVQKFGQTMQKKYSEIFSGEQSVSNEITDSIITVIQNDEDLNQQCHLG